MKISKKEGFIVVIFLIISTMYYLCLPTFPNILNGDFGEGAITLFYSLYSSICNGELSIWSPYIWCGIPSLGQTCYQAIYPVNLFIYYILKNTTFELFIVIDCAFHFTVLCSGLYFFQRLNKISIPASFLSTLLVSFSSEMMHQNHWIYLWTGFVWLPLIVDFVILFAKNSSLRAWKYVLCSGIALGLSGLANQGQTLLINILIVCFLYLCYLGTNFTKKYFLAITGKMMSFGILGIFICAPALLPAIEFSKNCTRYIPEMEWLSGLEKMTMEAFVKYDASFSSVGSLLQFPTINGDTNYYIFRSVGVMVSIFGILGFFAKALSQNKTISIFSKGYFAFVICYGTGFVIPYIFYYIPFYNAIREPFLYVPYLILPIILFVGYGLDLLKSDIYSIKGIKENISHPVCACIVLLVCLLGIMLPFNFQRWNLIITALILVAYFCNFQLRKQSSPKYVYSSIFVFTAFILQMSIYVNQLNNGISYKEIYAKLERQKCSTVENIINQANEHARYFGFGVDAWSANSLSLNQVCESQGYVNPLPRAAQLISTVALERRALIGNIKYWYTSPDSNDIYHQMIKGAESRYLGEIQVYPTFDSTETADFAVWEIDTMGTAWIVNDIIKIDPLDNLSSEQVTDLLSNSMIDFHTQSYVAYTNSVDSVESGENKWSATVKKYNSNSIDYLVETEKKSVLTTAEVWYPGWNVYIDGKKEEVLQVNCCFKGCIVPAGTHTVEFKYEPLSLYLGLVLCIVGILCWISIWFLMKLQLRNGVLYPKNLSDKSGSNK